MKIEEQVLSIEQMSHLKELGVEVKDTAMGWGWYHGLVNKQIKPVLLTEDSLKTFESVGVVVYPTLTLQEILDMLPCGMTWDTWQWEITSGGEEIEYNDGDGYTPHREINGSLLDKAYGMLCWVAENNFFR